MNDHVNYSIKLKPCKDVGDPIFVDFILTNTSDQDLMILKWNTPLEEITNDVFRITRGPYRIPYDGIMIKKGSPSASDYLNLPSGETVTSTTEITKHYGINKAGDYNIALKSEGINFIAIPKGSKPNLTEDQTAVQNAFELGTPNVPFTLGEGTGEPQKTLGRKARKISFGNSIPTLDELAELIHNEKSSTNPVSTVNSPYFVGGTQDQRDVVVKASEKAFVELHDCIEHLIQNLNPKVPYPSYEKWFGVYSTIKPGKRYAHVLGYLILIRNAMRDDTITYDLDPSDKPNTDGVFAWTYKGTLTVFMWKAFWKAKENGGHDTKSGTIIHELSHAITHLDDIGYGLNKVLHLAKTDPSEAIQSAENFEYFSEAYAMKKYEDKLKQDEIARTTSPTRHTTPHSIRGIPRANYTFPSWRFPPYVPVPEYGSTIDQYGRIIDPSDPIMHIKNND